MALFKRGAKDAKAGAKKVGKQAQQTVRQAPKKAAQKVKKVGLVFQFAALMRLWPAHVDSRLAQRI